MPLNPTFSVSPVKPRMISNEAYASLLCYGVFLDDEKRNLGIFNSSWRLEDQYVQDKAVFGLNGIPRPGTAFPDKWYRYSHANLSFAVNAGANNQVLLIYHLLGFAQAAPAIASFFKDGNFIAVENVLGERYVAILFPDGVNNAFVYMFLVDGYLELKGIEGYVI